MTLGNSANDYLFIHYKHKDIIIGRNQFSRSVSYSSIGSATTNIPYLEDLVEYGNEHILNFNLDEFLIDTFKVQIDNPTKLCIISSRDQFSNRTWDILSKILANCGTNISLNSISFSITSKSEIKKSTVLFKELSRVYKDCFINRGILSCSFLDQRIQYFIDIDKILYNLITTREVRHEDSYRE